MVGKTAGAVLDQASASLRHVKAPGLQHSSGPGINSTILVADNFPSMWLPWVPLSSRVRRNTHAVLRLPPFSFGVA